MLKEKVAEARTALRERTELRNEEKAENEKTIADAKEGADAIREAVTILKEYYGETELVQIKQHK